METKITSIFGIVEHVAPTRAGLEKQVNWLLDSEYSSSTEHDRNIRMQRGSITTIYTYSTALHHLCFFLKLIHKDNVFNELKRFLYLYFKKDAAR